MFAFLYLTVATIHAAPTLPADDKEEAFLVRRIAEYWKDQDFSVVKAQILDFLATHPKSKMTDHLKGILADLWLQEGNYNEALRIYNQIQAPQVIEKYLKLDAVVIGEQKFGVECDSPEIQKLYKQSQIFV